ncbi:MAG: phosphotransferase [Bdellovibrionales bacterium]|nr:phosphotransferase [Bdellovibrionales bacterium]
MGQIWDADIEVSLPLAKHLILSQFLKIACRKIVHLGEGFDNHVFLINDDIVFKFPRRKKYIDLIQNEMNVLSNITLRTDDVTVPIPKWVGQETKEFPWPFWGHDLIRGVEGHLVELTRNQLVNLGKMLGRFLRHLHRVDTISLESNIPPDTLGRLDVRKRTEKLKGTLEELNKKMGVQTSRKLKFFLESMKEFTLPENVTLVHGDLYARHLVINKGTLAGVIDWGDAHLGNPAIDLAIAYTFLSKEAREVFFENYGPVDDVTCRFALFRALCHTATVMIYAMTLENIPMLKQSQSAWKRCEDALD